MHDTYRHQIFIIDDSKVQLILLEKILANEGFAVRSFTNGYNLLHSLESHHPHLIISDIDMPLINGFELIGEVNKVQGEMEIPFFLISSDGGITVQEKARDAGAKVFLQKPFKYQVLIDVVREMLGPVEV